VLHPEFDALRGECGARVHRCQVGQTCFFCRSLLVPFSSALADCRASIHSSRGWRRPCRPPERAKKRGRGGRLQCVELHAEPPPGTAWAARGTSPGMAARRRRRREIGRHWTQIGVRGRGQRPRACRHRVWCVSVAVCMRTCARAHTHCKKYHTHAHKHTCTRARTHACTHTQTRTQTHTQTAASQQAPSDGYHSGEARADGEEAPGEAEGADKALKNQIDAFIALNDLPSEQGYHYYCNM
jgi:hypothetical protein